MNIQEELFRNQDKAYADFQFKLTPTISRESIIGVRVPKARELARQLIKDKEAATLFLHSLPHSYYDENLLHGLLISEIKDYETCLKEIKAFLPYVDNWAVCDTMSPKVFRKHKTELIHQIREWAESEKTYTCRFGMETLMRYYLDDDFKPEYLEIPASVHRDEYYVNMMIAWFFATALSKQWDATLPYLLENRLGTWVHNKSIQKALESNRITSEQKSYLKTLKR